MPIPARIKTYNIFTGDTNPTLQFTVRKADGSGALDVTGASALCNIRAMGATANAFGTTQATASIISGPTGRIDWSWPAGGVTDPGIYFGQLKITFPGGRIQRTQKFNLQIEEGL